jgi:ribonuclease P protein subunit RPR2
MAKRIKYKQKEEHRKIALERIKTLFKEAKSTFKKDSKLSDRYMFLARKMSMKYKVRFTSVQKRQFCKKCYAFLVPSKTCRVRVYKGMIRYNCLKCKNIQRIKISST